MNKSESIKNIAVAMNKAQSQMGGASKDSANPFFKSKYADLSSVVQAIKEPFADNGLSYVQFPIEDQGRIGVETMIMHTSGEYLSQSFTVQLTKQDAQGAGSAITYCRRYGLQAVAGIPSEDDDGNHAAQKQAGPAKLPSVRDIQTALDDLDEKQVKSMVGKLPQGILNEMFPMFKPEEQNKINLIMGWK